MVISLLNSYSWFSSLEWCQHVLFPAPLIPKAKVEVVSFSFVLQSAVLFFSLRFQQVFSVLLVWVSLLIYDLPNQMMLPEEQLMSSFVCCVQYWDFLLGVNRVGCWCILCFWIVYLDVMLLFHIASLLLKKTVGFNIYIMDTLHMYSFFFPSK